MHKCMRVRRGDGMKASFVRILKGDVTFPSVRANLFFSKSLKLSARILKHTASCYTLCFCPLAHKRNLQ